jgi:hypothetical protein
LAYVPKVMGYTLDFKKTTKYERIWRLFEQWWRIWWNLYLS